MMGADVVMLITLTHSEGKRGGFWGVRVLSLFKLTRCASLSATPDPTTSSCGQSGSTSSVGSTTSITGRQNGGSTRRQGCSLTGSEESRSGSDQGRDEAGSEATRTGRCEESRLERGHGCRHGQVATGATEERGRESADATRTDGGR